jgi:hydrogenase nickel incorporation protein HypA/HybF
MHELGMTQRLMDLVLEKAEVAGATRVVRVNVAVGQSSGLVPDSIAFYFDYLKEGTIAEDAELHFRNIPTVLHCRECDLQFEVGRERWSCPKCRGMSVDRLQGGDSYLESLEVE